MPDNPETIARGTAPDTADQIGDAAEDVTEALKAFPAAIKTLTDHMESFVSELARLHPLEAVKQAPAAASALVGEGAEAAGDTLAAGGHVVGAVPAAATDVLDTAQTAGKEAVKTGRRFTLQKHRRG